MFLINRCALVVRPRRPYLDWANSFDDSPNHPEDGEQTVYLAPDFESDRGVAAYLRRHYPRIFEAELRAWMLDESTWPAQRDFETFNRWFEVEYHSIVADLCDTSLEKDLEPY